MLLNNLDPEKAKIIHSKQRFLRLFTFSNIYINNKNKQAHFYLSGKDELIKEMVNHLAFNQLIRIDDMVLNIINISLIPDLNKKEEYTFKTKLIINISQNNKCVLCDNEEYIQKRIIQIALSKAKKLNINTLNKNLQCKIINKKKEYDKYKNHHIESWNCKIKLKGNYELINLLYNVGIGENTASGHGLLWEVA